jgi:hypothetical protein
MKLLAFFLLQGLYQKLDNKRYFSWRKIQERPIFLALFSERFHLLLKFHFVDNKNGQYHETRYNSENCRVALCAARFPMSSYGS